VALYIRQRQHLHAANNATLFCVSVTLQDCLPARHASAGRATAACSPVRQGPHCGHSCSSRHASPTLWLCAVVASEYLGAKHDASCCAAHLLQ
jgi:hypothetical protein